MDFDLDPGLHQIEQVLARHLGNPKTLVLLKLDEPFRFEAHQSFAQRADAHTVAFTQCLKTQAFVGHETAGNNV